MVQVKLCLRSCVLIQIYMQITQIELPSGRKFKYVYDDSGGLLYAELPSGSKHTFCALTSLGFLRYVYLAPGASRPYIQHYSYTGLLLQEVNPSDGTRILYRYLSTGQLSEVKISSLMLDFCKNLISSTHSIWGL